MTPLREWEKRVIGQDGMTRPIANKLLALARSSPLGGIDGTRILVDGGRHIRAQNVVGVLAVDDVVLEILPKIDCPNGDVGVRHCLIHMLAIAYGLEIAPGASAALGIQTDTVLEILIRLFADKLIEEVRRGLPRKYVEVKDDLAAIRGKLDVTRQLTVLAANPARLACSFDELTTDTVVNRIMKMAVDSLRMVARHSETKRRLFELSAAYGDVPMISRTEVPINRIILDRTNRRWQSLINFAQLLLAGRYQTTSVGDTNGTALLFNMGRLFELCIARSIRNALRDTEIEVYNQGGLKFCLTEEESGITAQRRHFQTRPDILFKKEGLYRAIIDTKWKRLVNLNDDVKRGVSQSDVYQMMAYSSLYDGSDLMLLYPYHYGLQEDQGIMSRYNISGTSSHLTVGTIDVSNLTSFEMRLKVLCQKFAPHLFSL